MFQLSSILSLVFLTAAVSAGADLPRNEVGERLDRHLSRLEKLGFSGALVVTGPEDFEFRKAYGYSNREAGIRTTDETVFPLGSITKHFTAAAILRLEMDGMLSVEDPIDYYFEDLPEEKAGITIHQLLSHTSGLPSGGMTVLAATDADDFIARCFAIEMAFPPGMGARYSNLGYGVLAAIIERVAGTTWEQYLTEAIFVPAGMTSTGSQFPDWPEKVLAHGYIDDRDTGTLVQSGGLGSWGLIGAGGLLSTTRDMQRWNQALVTRSVLDEAAIQKMTNAHANSGIGMGYGVGTGKTDDGRPWFGHDGSNDVFSAEFRCYPEDGVFLFSAGNNADIYCFEFTSALERIVFGGEQAEPPSVVSLAEEELNAFVGAWTLPNGDEVEVGRRQGGLVLSSGGQRAAALLHPVKPHQVDRRSQLLLSVESAFRAAFEADFDELHKLLDPFAPDEEFAEMWGGSLEGWSAQLGLPESVRAVPGRNRFGEVAIIAVLSFENGERQIEYSFGEREVGSIRFINRFPRRVVYPAGEGAFIAYDVESESTWRVSFQMDQRGVPTALSLEDEGGASLEATRGI